MAEDVSKIAVVDGANIAFIEQTKDGKPKVSNIVAVCDELRERGYDVLIVIDASLHHIVDQPGQLDALVDRQKVRQAPAGTDADYFVLATADEMGAIVVSNDQYSAYRDRFGWIAERRMPLMIVRGSVELYEPPAEAKSHGEHTNHDSSHGHHDRGQHDGHDQHSQQRQNSAHGAHRQHRHRS